MTPRTRTSAGLAAVLALGAGGGAGAVAVLDRPAPTTVTAAAPATAAPVASIAKTAGLTVDEIYERTKQGVVDITTSDNGSRTGGGGGEGSGFVLDDGGDIVTNQHVVANAGSISVKFADGRKASAKVVGTDPSSDVAVIHVDVPSSDLEPLTFADSSQVGVGDPVVAIGSPFGLPGTVTTGIISALNRSITSPTNYAISGTLQTDAAINPGNSGGPLLDAAGHVVGMNSQIESNSDGNTGVGFAIASDTVRRVAQQLAARQTVRHAYLGVSLGDAANGAAIGSVRSGGPAAEAGVRAGDVVTAIDGKAVGTGDDAAAAIDARSPGDKVTLTVERSGRRVTIPLTLGTRPASSA